MNTTHLLEYVIIAYRSSFILGLISLLVAKSILPEFLQYGKTLTINKNTEDVSTKEFNNIYALWDKIVHFTVPKSWFTHFYYLSTSLSVITLISYYQQPIVWLLLFHSLRRLYETLYVLNYKNNAQMNWSHYLVGLWFYSVLHLMVRIKLSQDEMYSSLNYTSLIIFLLASWDQNRNHHVLASLVKYSLPTERLFQWCCNPHYFDEVIIYACLIPYHREFSWQVIWVITSLTISATETRNYYTSKFKELDVPRYSIIPFVI